MSEHTHTDRFRLLALLAFTGVLALASFWLLEVMRKNVQETVVEDKLNEPDYFVENFRAVRVTRNGQPHYIMAGKNLVHRPLTDRSDIEQAQVLAFHPTHAPLTVQAKQAQIEHQTNRIQLLDDVQLMRAETPSAAGWLMTTTKLLVLPDEDQMHTDQPVQINHGKSVLHGKGMFIDNTRSVFRLENAARGIFQPAPQAARSAP